MVQPEFGSDTIALRPFEPGDAPGLYAYLTHPELAGRRYIPWKFEQTLPFPLKTAGDIIEDWNGMENGFCLAVTLKTDGSLIGHARAGWGWDALMPEVAVVIAPPHQRKGFGRQVLSWLLDYLFDFTVARNVSNGIEEWNAPALAFAQRLGFSQAGVLRRVAYRGGWFYDEHLYEILKPEWRERNHAA